MNHIYLFGAWLFVMLIAGTGSYMYYNGPKSLPDEKIMERAFSNINIRNDIIIFDEYEYPCEFDYECGNGFCQNVNNPVYDKLCMCQRGYLHTDNGPCTYRQTSAVGALLFSIFLGYFGADWFWVSRGSCGYITAGIFKLLTIGGCGIWALVDIIRIAAGAFPDGNGFPLTWSY